MKAIRLQVEYLNEPIGIDVKQPRFYWNCEGGVKQTAYQIVAKRGVETIWDSGKVESSAMAHIKYEGKPLKSRDIVTWSVTLWDENGEAGETSESKFEMGLLDSADWKAKWISGNYKPNGKMRYPVDCFKKDFTVSGNIVKARLYATARGVYDATINGKRIENFILAPGSTDYRKHIQYQTYDVTELIKDNNTLELRLADGWFRGSVAAYGVVNVFGKQTSLMAQLEITLDNGMVKTISTDKAFQWSNDGAIRFADLKDGEIYNASKVPTYNSNAIEVAPPKAEISASNNVYVTEHEEFSAKLLTAKDGTSVLDFGQNIAGYLKFTVKGSKEQKFRLICGETLDENGRVDMSGIQDKKPVKGWNQMSLVKKLVTNQVSGETIVTPKQEIDFICSGSVDNYKTSFAVFGFRYAEIDGDIEINENDFKAIAVYSDMEQTGRFTCSNDRINKLFNNTLWSMKGNFLDVPTDCPTRERLGWTGDAQIFFNTGAYLMNTAPFFSKWLRDMAEGQYKNGLIPAVLPFNGVEMMYKATGSSVGWADAIYLIPYRYYKRFGDKEILSKYWNMMKKYSDYLMTNLGMKDKKEAKANPNNAYTYEKGVHLGEWLEPEEFRDKVYGTSAKHPEECTAYLYYTMTTMAEIAGIVGEKEYKKTLEKYAAGAKKAYNDLFVKTGTLDTDRQAKLVRPLALGVLDGEDKKNAENRLVKAVENYGYRVGTGFLSTPFILGVLSDAGKMETAYKMLECTDRPSWLYEVENGATTIWESWEGDLSLNHYSPGAVCQWLFDTVCGIKVDDENHFIIQPVPGGTLTNACASYKSIYGEIKSSWEMKDGETVYKVTVPSNVTATVILPNSETQVVNSGEYEFTVR